MFLKQAWGAVTWVRAFYISISTAGFTAIILFSAPNMPERIEGGVADKKETAVNTTLLCWRMPGFANMVRELRHEGVVQMLGRSRSRINIETRTFRFVPMNDFEVSHLQLKVGRWSKS